LPRRWSRSLQFADFAASFLLSGVLFALVFRFVPDTSVAWRDVWLGASLGGLLFGVGKLAMQLYLAKARVVTTYGAAGSLVVILLMANYSAQVLFVGAELTKAYAYRYGSRAGSEPGHLTGASSLAPASSSQP
jgi:membrane protein